MNSKFVLLMCFMILVMLFNTCYAMRCFGKKEKRKSKEEYNCMNEIRAIFKDAVVNSATPVNDAAIYSIKYLTLKKFQTVFTQLHHALAYYELLKANILPGNIQNLTTFCKGRNACIDTLKQLKFNDVDMKANLLNAFENISYEDFYEDKIRENYITHIAGNINLSSGKLKGPVEFCQHRTRISGS